MKKKKKKEKKKKKKKKKKKRKVCMHKNPWNISINVNSF